MRLARHFRHTCVQKYLTFRRSRLAVSVAAALAMTTSFSLQSTTSAVAGKRVPEIGVNRPNLAELPEDQWKATLESMSRAGVQLLRTNAAAPSAQVARLIRHANDRGIQVILIVPLWLPALYPPHVQPRQGNANYFAVRPISRIDPVRFRALWNGLRESMRAAGAHALAYQIGNELNGAGFNGDYPIADDARLIALDSCDLPRACKDILDGLALYVDLLRIVRESDLLDGALLLPAGLAKTSEAWAARTKGFFSTPSATIRHLETLGTGRFVEAYAVHIYPNASLTNPKTGARDVKRQIADVVSECVPSGLTTKPCWVTEWGIASQHVSCEQDPSRMVLQEAGLRMLRDFMRRDILETAIYYDWDADGSLSVFRCGRLVDPAVVIPPPVPQ